MRVGRYCRNVGGNSLLFLKNGWEWVNFSLKMGGSRSFLSRNGWEWVFLLKNGLE